MTPDVSEEDLLLVLDALRARREQEDSEIAATLGLSRPAVRRALYKLRDLRMASYRRIEKNGEYIRFLWWAQ